MTFQTGHEKIGGRSKGMPNKKTLARLKTISKILALCENELEADVTRLTPVERIKLWKSMAAYNLPKFAAAHMELEQPEPQKMTITEEILYRCIPDDELEAFQQASSRGENWKGGIVTKEPLPKRPNDEWSQPPAID